MSFNSEYIQQLLNPLEEYTLESVRDIILKVFIGALVQ